MSKKLMLVALLIVISSVSGRAQQNSIIGTWKVAAIALPNQPKIQSPQPGIYIFTAKYYSILRINSERPGAGPATRAQSNDGDIPALYDALTAESGSYTVIGYRLRTHSLAAKSPSIISGPESEFEFAISGKNLLITSHPADGGTPTVIALTRLEF